MTNHEPLLAVLLDATDIRRALKGWPEDMMLAVCLSDDGVCRLIVFHAEELLIMPDRLCAMMGVPESAIQVVPEMHGFATFRFRYTDEIAVLSILEGSQDILDEAEDYAANYAFAKEEGLSPSRFMGLPVCHTQARQNRKAQNSEAAQFGMLRPKRVDEIEPLLNNRHKATAQTSRRFVFSSVRRPHGSISFKQSA